MIIRCAYDDVLPIAKLKKLFHSKNRNKHPQAQIERLAKILEYQGARYPAKISKLSGRITAGHGTILAAEHAGWKEYPVNYQDYDDETQEIADLTSDNSIAAWAELDLSGINADIGDLGPDFDVDLLGLKGFTVDVSEHTRTTPGEGEEDAVPEVKDEPKTKRGDLYILGSHRLLCGDSTILSDVEMLMNGEKADLVLTDPPYNIGSHSKNYVAQSSNHLRGDLSKAMKDLADADWDKNFDIKNVLPNLLIASKEDCSYYIFTSQFLIGDIWEFFYASEMKHVSYNIWNKPNPMPCLSKRHWTWCNEMAAYATRGKHTFNFPESGHAYSVWTFTKHSDGSHPTQKPIELLEHIMTHSSNPSHNVLDLFGGSGSVLIAAEKTNRRCFMMEIDPHYTDVIVSRYCRYSSATHVLLNNAEVEWTTP